MILAGQRVAIFLSPLMPDIYFASENAGKIKEVQEILRLLPFEIKSVNDLSDNLQAYSPVESGETFTENAKIKARELHTLCHQPVIADDSGLEVDALGGRPGVHSSRYGASDKERNQKLLKELEPFRDREITARFVCCICYLDAFGNETYFSGTVQGTIINQPRGENGFGYDPVFFIPEMGKTFAEMSPDQKAAISHRGRALRLLAQFLHKQT